MKQHFKSLRNQQLANSIQPFLQAKGSPRPQKGWLRAIREASGVTLQELAKRLHRANSVVAHLETSEAEYRITLGKLREAADALGCQLVYALVPKNGSIQDLAEARARSKATENVRAVEHSMALEDQAVGNVEEKIKDEAQRLLKKNRGK
ncbi:MAG TPA: helix-turn-helix domain-containing protein [Terriglobales bacterium]|nr:helix-turn-helix domain-containing protein [Terriglobales bacterium]